MSAALTIGIRIADSANAILQRVEAFDHENLQNNEEWDMRAHIGIEPMLLALSMELALKAWYVLDQNKPKGIKGHILTKLFEKLKPESQDKLDSAFRQSVGPPSSQLFIR